MPGGRDRAAQSLVRGARARAARALAQPARASRGRDRLERRAPGQPRRHRLDRVRRHDPRRAPARDRGTHDARGRPQLEPGRAPGRRRAPAVALDRARPREALPRPRAARREEDLVKIGIVSPYAYPRPGGANAHIRESYEELRRLGHEVRIITAPWGDDPRARDVIRIGRAIAVPFNGSVGRITLSLRLDWLVNRMLKREAFDIIHHHEPLVPFLSPQILENAECAQVATFHAFGGFSFSYWLGRPLGRHFLGHLEGRIAVSSAARFFVERYFPGEYEIIPN
ncbi:MAG: glycosyltransferase, partial [Chloroflexi bacterium]|nr:glycosyltransferase [Chloroflexota bacterium]